MMFSVFKRVKKGWNNFLGNLAKSNEDNFGSGKMDCCDLNKKNEKKDH